MKNNIIDREKLEKSGLSIAEFLDTFNLNNQNCGGFFQYISSAINGINAAYDDVLGSNELQTKITDIINSTIKTTETLIMLLDYIVISIQAYNTVEEENVGLASGSIVDLAAGLIISTIQEKYSQEQQELGSDLPILTSDGYMAQTGALVIPQAYHIGSLEDYAKTGAEVTSDATSTLEEELINQWGTQQEGEQILDMPTASAAAGALSDAINTNSGESIQGKELKALNDDNIDNIEILSNDNIDVLEEDEGLFDFGEKIIKVHNNVTKPVPTKVKSSALGIGGGILGVATMAGAGVMAKKYNDKKEKQQEKIISEEPQKEENKEQSKIISIKDINELDKNNQVLEEATTNGTVGSDFFNMNN